MLAGHRPGRTDAAQVTVFDSVGFALEDFSALCFMRDAAAELGIGDRIELVPMAANPKDLFGLLGEPQVGLRAGLRSEAHGEPPEFSRQLAAVVGTRTLA